MSIVFRRPAAVALSSDGSLYVTDRDSNGLFTFFPDGAFRHFYQSSELGNLIRPRGVCFDESGRLLVADSGNGRILVFESGLHLSNIIDLSSRGPLIDSLANAGGSIFCSDLNNHVIYAIGAQDGEVKYTLGGPGSATGRLRSPRGVCVVGERLMVADRDNDRICSFDLVSGRVHSFLNAGQGKGSIRRPTDVKCIDNKLYVNDSNNYLIQVFSTEFEFLFQFGRKGTEIGDFDLVSTLSVHETALYICDRNNDRILRYRPESAGIEVVVAPTFTPGVLRRPSGAAVDRHNRIYVADRDNDCLQIFDLSGRVLNTVKDVSRPSAVALTTDSPPMMWVAERGSHQLSLMKESGERIKTVHSLANTTDLKHPHDITMDSHGNLFVADSGNRAIQRLSSSGAYRGTINMAEVSGNPLIQVRSVCSTRDGSIYTADFDRCIVYCLNPDGTPRWAMNMKNICPDMTVLRGVFVHDERIIVCARGQRFIYIFSSCGQLIRKFGSRGKGNDQFRNPVKVIRIHSGNYIVVDKENDRLVVYDEAWKYQGEFGDLPLLHSV
jgi:sugar lactone lactonase YvrE